MREPRGEMEKLLPTADAIHSGISSAHRRLLTTFESKGWIEMAVSSKPGGAPSYPVTERGKNIPGLTIEVSSKEGNEIAIHDRNKGWRIRLSGDYIRPKSVYGEPHPTRITPGIDFAGMHIASAKQTLNDQGQAHVTNPVARIERVDREIWRDSGAAKLNDLVNEYERASLSFGEISEQTGEPTTQMQSRNKSGALARIRAKLGRQKPPIPTPV